MLDDHLQPIYISYVQTHDVALNTYRKRWMIEMNGEGESGRSVLETLHDDDYHSFTLAV